LDGQLATRTRSLPELVRARLQDGGMAPEMAAVAAQKASGFGTEAGTETKPNAGGKYRTAQTMFLSDGDVQAVADTLREAAEKAGTPDKFAKLTAKELQKAAEDRGFRPVAVDVALFGRMVTSEAFVDVEASSQFAHAISTHKVDHEFDYYTAVDDLERAADDTAGAGADMIGDTEFNSACYYKYFNVHVDGLLENLDPRAGDRDAARATAATTVRALLESAVRVSPSAKQNAFAAFQLPSLVLVEVRPDNLPVSYANAFVKPVDPKRGEGVVAESAARLVEEAQKLTQKFDLKATDRFLLLADDALPTGGIEAVPSLGAMLDRVEAAVRNA
ncbi:MAG TPA: type I-E CRISPR-associated protein Cas7/Cse4/CasC, partial [Armatimonadota bacterium]|nr:type I-E CRISPR-associated protein Cas7/Cse4/CasC [Armatimonadota bacterium]